MNEFERSVRKKLKEFGPANRIYLKKNYSYEIFGKHNLTDDEINVLFDMKKIIAIYHNLAFEERIDAEIQISKIKKIKVIFQFEPFVNGKKQEGKVGIITAFSL